MVLLLVLRRHARWAVPLSAGLALCYVPRSSHAPLAVLASPTLIPAAPPRTVILSPSEAHLSLTATLRNVLQNTIVEPILTAKRFVYLLFLFAPVFLASPMLLVGTPDKALKGDRWGAVWWYGLLVSRMEAAGPTFIKACRSFRLSKLY